MMTNKYPGKCAKCGQTVAAGQGNLEKAIEGHPDSYAQATGNVQYYWVVTHKDCPRPSAAAQAAKEKRKEDERQALYNRIGNDPRDW